MKNMHKGIAALMCLALMLTGCLKANTTPDTTSGGISETAPAAQTNESAAPSPVELKDGEWYRVAANEFLSLRVRPDTQAERLKKLEPGMLVKVLEKNGDFSFVEVETGEIGYVLSSYLLSIEEYAAMASDIIRYVNAQQFLTLRAAPETSAAEIDRLQFGEKVRILSTDQKFAYIEVQDSGQKGYVLESYLSEQVPVTNNLGEYVVRAREFLTLRKDASLGADKIGQVSAGEKVTLMGFDGLFAYIKTKENTQGYVLSGYLELVEKTYLSELNIAKITQNYSYEQLSRDLKELSRLYPKKLKIDTIGKSLKGRDIPVAVLGNLKVDHHVLIQASIHARESMTALLCVKQLEYCLRFGDNKLDERTIDSLLNDVCFHIIPMANPDGVAISQSKQADETIRSIYQSDLNKGYTDLPLEEYLKVWKANAAGADINRNFSTGWQDVVSRTAPSNSLYKGGEPEDQPETKALAEYTKKYKFDATISYHAFGSCLYWNYGSDSKVNDRSKELARTVCDQTKYPLAPSTGLDAGGYKDWAMDTLKIPSLTIEVGSRECPLPEDEFYTIFERNRLVLPAVAHWVISQ